MSVSPLKPQLSPALRGLSWPGVELRHLTAFRAVVEEGSFARAAVRLGYTQGAISQQIAALERAVGHRLLDRPGGRGRPAVTEAGEIVLERADAIARELALARVALDRLDSGSTTSPLRVGMRPDTGVSLFPSIVDELPEASPALFRLVERRTDCELNELVSFGEVDVAFVESAADELACATVVSEPFVAVVGAELRDLLDPPLTAEQLSAHSLLLLRASVDCGCPTELGSDPAFEADQPEILCELAERGHGIAVLPRSLASRHARHGTATLDLAAPLRREVFAVWRSDGTRAVGLREMFVAAVRSRFASARFIRG